MAVSNPMFARDKGEGVKTPRMHDARVQYKYQLPPKTLCCFDFEKLL